MKIIKDRNLGRRSNLEPKIRYSNKYKEINEALPKLLQILEKHKIIKIDDENFVEILSDKLFFDLGYILFLLHIGRKLNHKNKEGYFHFITANAENVFVLKHNVKKSGEFWLFYNDNFLYLQETLLLHPLINEIYKLLINKQDIFSSKEIRKLINVYTKHPKELIDPKYEIIDAIEFPVKILSNILKSINNFEEEIDLFQLFLYFYFRIKMKVVYLEAYCNNFENKNTWDIVAYDKNMSKKVFLVELTTGHTAERLLKKFPSFLESIDRNYYAIYITPIEKADTGIPEFLDYFHQQFPNNLIVINSYVPMEPEDINKGNKARECYNNIIDQLNQIVELARKID